MSNLIQRKIIALLYANLRTNTVYIKNEFYFVDRTNIDDTHSW